MTHDEFLNLVYPFIDGELDSVQRLEVEAYLENSQEARALVEQETQFRNKCRESLNEEADLVTKGRLLAEFRATTQDLGPKAAEPVVTETPTEGGFLNMLQRSWQISVAAGIMFMIAWFGGAFDQGGLQSAKVPEDLASASTQLIDVVQVAETNFTGQLAKEAKKHDCRYECIKQFLGGCSDAQFWPHESKTPRAEREETVAKMASKCMKRSIVLPCLPDRFELVGARRTTLDYNGNHIEVPHLILMTDQESLSVYVICGTQSAAIAKGLQEITSRKSDKDSCLFGCPQRGVMVRQCGDVFLVLISKMAYKKLQDLAEEL